MEGEAVDDGEAAVVLLRLHGLRPRALVDGGWQFLTGAHRHLRRAGRLFACLDASAGRRAGSRCVAPYRVASGWLAEPPRGREGTLEVSLPLAHSPSSPARCEEEARGRGGEIDGAGAAAAAAAAVATATATARRRASTGGGPAAHARVDVVGSCRLCLVEIDGRRGTPASCTTLAEAGMVVHTQTERLQKLRRGVIELYVSDHPLDRLTCSASREPQPQLSLAGRKRPPARRHRGPCEATAAASFLSVSRVDHQDAGLFLLSFRVQAKYGRHAVGGSTSSRCTNEETFLVQELVRGAFANNNADTCARVCHAPTG